MFLILISGRLRDACNRRIDRRPARLPGIDAFRGVAHHAGHAFLLQRRRKVLRQLREQRVIFAQDRRIERAIGQRAIHRAARGAGALDHLRRRVEARMIGMSGPVGQHERDRPHPLEPMMHAQLVPRMADHKRAALVVPGIRTAGHRDTLHVRVKRTRIVIDVQVRCHARKPLYNDARMHRIATKSVAFRAQMTASRPERVANSSGTPEAPALAVRWLAEQCGLPAAPAPHLASAMIAHDARAVVHVAWWSRHADAESNFVRATRDLADGTDAVRVAALLARGYEGFLYLQDDAIVGHFFFQRHDDEMHAFAGWSDESLRASGLIANAALDFIAYARATAGIVRVRVGTGEHPIAHACWRRSRRSPQSLAGACATDAGWISRHALRHAGIARAILRLMHRAGS